MTSERGIGRRLRVLTSFRQPSATTTPYIAQLYQALSARPGLEVSTFSWRLALFSTWDVFHVHWPNTTFAPPDPLWRLAKQCLFALFLFKAVLSRTAIVWTLHNLRPHEKGDPVERSLVWLLTRATAHFITLNQLTPIPFHRPSTLILHGHYIGWYGRFPAADVVPGRVAMFGLLRAYKGVEDLLQAFSEWSHPGVSLAIGGEPADAATGVGLARLADGDPRIDLTLRFLDESELVTLVSQAELLVFPYVAMHNSGAVLAALSLGRAVLVPSNEVNDQLADEVGEQWVQRFDGRVTALALEEALAAVRAIPNGASPQLASRDWRTAGELHEQAYRDAVRRRKRR